MTDFSLQCQCLVSPKHCLSKTKNNDVSRQFSDLLYCIKTNLKTHVALTDENFWFEKPGNNSWDFMTITEASSVDAYVKL